MIKVIKKADNIDDGIQNMIEGMVDDYYNWNKDGSVLDFKNPEHKDYAIERVRKFKKDFKVTKGKKYIKVVNENSVRAFIVQEDGDYPKGTILKPASWNIPAKHSRGNVLDGNYHIQWTGPLYLK